MDSFILYNAEINPTNNEQVLAAEPKEIEERKKKLFRFKKSQIQMTNQMTKINLMKMKN